MDGTDLLRCSKVHQNLTLYVREEEAEEPSEVIACAGNRGAFNDTIPQVRKCSSTGTMDANDVIIMEDFNREYEHGIQPVLADLDIVSDEEGNFRVAYVANSYGHPEGFTESNISWEDERQRVKSNESSDIEDTNCSCPCYVHEASSEREKNMCTLMYIAVVFAMIIFSIIVYFVTKNH